MKERTNKIHITLTIPSKKYIIIFLLILVLIFGGSLVYSAKLQLDGDNVFKKQQYKNALTKYTEAKNWWIVEKINFQNIELKNKINHVKWLIPSDENYQKGIGFYKKNDFVQTEYYLSLVNKIDPHYQEVIEILKISRKAIADKEKKEKEDWQSKWNKTMQPSTTNSEQINVNQNSLSGVNPLPTNTSASPNYKYDSDYPIITKFEGFGETFYHSYGNGLSGKYFIEKVYYPGDTLHFKLEAKDPKGRSIQYKIKLYNGQEVFNSNEVNIVLNDKDISDNNGVTASVTANSFNHRFGDNDDYVQFMFKVRQK